MTLRYSEIFSIVRDAALARGRVRARALAHIHARKRNRGGGEYNRDFVVDVNFLSGRLACIRASASLIRSERHYYFHARRRRPTVNVQAANV